MNKTQAKRLADLADLVELKNERFNFGTWVGENYKGNADLSCGTTACALGWATTIPALRRLGLRMADTGMSNYAPANYVPAVERTRDLRKIGKILFGLMPSESIMLFLPNHGIGTSSINGREWANQARRFLVLKMVQGNKRVLSRDMHAPLI